MPLSPGLSLILGRLLPKLLMLPAMISGGCRIATVLHCDHYIPGFLKTPLGFVLFTGTCFIGRGLLAGLWSSYKRRRDLRRAGARSIQRIKGGKWPSNMDIAIRLANGFEVEYIGERFMTMYEENGDLFNMNILGRDIVSSRSYGISSGRLSG